MNLNQTQVDELYGIAVKLDASLRIDYSGRGMFGGKCIGFVTNNPARFAIKLVREMLTYDFKDDPSIAYILDKMELVQTDGMGNGSILYFPHLRADLGVKHPEQE